MCAFSVNCEFLVPSGKKKGKNEEKLLDNWEYMKIIYAKSL